MIHPPIFAESWHPLWLVLIVPPQGELAARKECIAGQPNGCLTVQSRT